MAGVPCAMWQVLFGLLWSSENLSLYTRISSNQTDELSHRFALLHDVIWFLLSGWANTGSDDSVCLEAMAIQGSLSSSKTATSQDRNMLLNSYRSQDQQSSNLCLWSAKQSTKQGHSWWATWRVLPEVQWQAHTLILCCSREGSPSCSTLSFSLKITFLFYVKSRMLPNQCSRQGSLQANSSLWPVLASSSFGQERRAEEGGAWERERHKKISSQICSISLAAFKRVLCLYFWSLSKYLKCWKKNRPSASLG